MSKQPDDRIDADLTEELRHLRREVQKLNAHRLIRRDNSVWRTGLFQFFRGLAFGLGSVLGATMLVSLVVYMLSSIDFIPVIGEWAERIIEQIKAPD